MSKLSSGFHRTNITAYKQATAFQEQETVADSIQYGNSLSLNDEQVKVLFSYLSKVGVLCSTKGKKDEVTLFRNLPHELDFFIIGLFDTPTDEDVQYRLISWVELRADGKLELEYDPKTRIKPFQIILHRDLIRRIPKPADQQDYKDAIDGDDSEDEIIWNEAKRRYTWECTHISQPELLFGYRAGPNPVVTLSSRCDFASYMEDPNMRYAAAYVMPDDSDEAVQSKSLRMFLELPLYPLRTLDRLVRGKGKSHLLYEGSTSEDLAPSLKEHTYKRAPHRGGLWNKNFLVLDEKTLYSPLFPVLRLDQWTGGFHVNVDLDLLKDMVGDAFFEELAELDEATARKKLMRKLHDKMSSIIHAQSSIFASRVNLNAGGGRVLFFQDVFSETLFASSSDADLSFVDLETGKNAFGHDREDRLVRGVRLRKTRRVGKGGAVPLYEVTLQLVDPNKARRSIRRNGSYEGTQVRGEQVGSSVPPLRAFLKTLTGAIEVSFTVFPDVLKNTGLKTMEALWLRMVKNTSFDPETPVSENAGGQRRQAKLESNLDHMSSNFQGSVQRFSSHFAYRSMEATGLLYWNQLEKWLPWVASTQKEIRAQVRRYINTQTLPPKLRLPEMTEAQWRRLDKLFELRDEDADLMCARIQDLLTKTYDAGAGRHKAKGEGSNLRVTRLPEIAIGFLIFWHEFHSNSLIDLFKRSPLVSAEDRALLKNPRGGDQERFKLLTRTIKDVHAFLEFAFGIDVSVPRALHMAVASSLHETYTQRDPEFSRKKRPDPLIADILSKSKMDAMTTLKDALEDNSKANLLNVTQAMFTGLNRGTLRRRAMTTQLERLERVDPKKRTQD